MEVEDFPKLPMATPFIRQTLDAHCGNIKGAEKGCGKLERLKLIPCLV